MALDDEKIRGHVALKGFFGTVANGTAPRKR